MATSKEIQDGQEVAINQAFEAANAFLTKVDALANIGFNENFLAQVLPNINYEERNPLTEALDLLLGMRPQRPFLPAVGVAVNLPPDLSFSSIENIPVPEFAGSAPAVTLPEAPTISLPSVPAQPTIQDITLPSAPVLTMPTAPNVGTIDIPLPPTINIPEFTAGLPAEDFFAPSNDFEFHEEAYSSELLDALIAKLLGDVRNGGYGIEPWDEADLWNRARDRETETALMETEEVYRAAGARGFSLPPNDLAVALERTHKSVQDKLSSVSRDIALKRSELYVQNRQFAMTESRAIETTLMNYHNSVQERALNVAKATLDASITIYEAQLKRYNARLDAYKTESVVFEAKIRAALSQVEIYRVQIQGKQVEADIQRQSVEIYRAQLAGVESIVNIYRAQMEAANVHATVQRTKIDAFRSMIDAYVAQVNAGNARLQMFEAQIRGELAKVQVFEAQVRSFNAQIEGTKTKSDIALGRARAETERANAELAKYRGYIDAAELVLKSQIAVLSGVTQVYQSDITSYNAATNAASEAYRLMQQSQRNEQDLLLKTAEVKMNNAKLILEGYQTEFQTKLKANELGIDFHKNWLAGLTGSLIGIATTSG